MISISISIFLCLFLVFSLPFLGLFFAFSLALPISTFVAENGGMSQLAGCLSTFHAIVF